MAKGSSIKAAKSHLDSMGFKKRFSTPNHKIVFTSAIGKGSFSSLGGGKQARDTKGRFK
jgi:hypothetical protein